MFQVYMRLLCCRFQELICCHLVCALFQRLSSRSPSPVVPAVCLWPSCQVISLQSDPSASSHFTLSRRVCVYLQSLALTRVCSVVLDPLRPRGLWLLRLLCPWDSPGKSTRVGCYFLLQRIFQTQGSNPHLLCLLHWQLNSLLLSHLGSL